MFHLNFLEGDNVAYTLKSIPITALAIVQLSTFHHGESVPYSEFKLLTTCKQISTYTTPENLAERSSFINVTIVQILLLWRCENSSTRVVFLYNFGYKWPKECSKQLYVKHSSRAIVKLKAQRYKWTSFITFWHIEMDRRKMRDSSPRVSLITTTQYVMWQSWSFVQLSSIWWKSTNFFFWWNRKISDLVKKMLEW